MPGAFLKQVQSNRRFNSMFCENCGHQISDTAKFCSACGHPVGTAPSPGAVAPPAVPAKRESPRLKASSGNGSITRMSGTRRKPWLLRMPIPDPHTGITVMKAVGTYKVQMLCGKNKRRKKGKTTQMLYDNLRGVFGFARSSGVSGLSS